MTKRSPCPPAPGPLEDYAVRFDDLFGTLAQRRGFREYLTGLLLPRDRNKTLTALTGAEPIVDAQAAPVQSLQFFLSESVWEAESVNACRLEMLWSDSQTTPTKAVSSLSTRPATARTTPRLLTWRISIWDRSARSPTGSSRCRASGLTNACTIRCT